MIAVSVELTWAPICSTLGGDERDRLCILGNICVIINPQNGPNFASVNTDVFKSTFLLDSYITLVDTERQ